MRLQNAFSLGNACDFVTRQVIPLRAFDPQLPTSTLQVPHLRRSTVAMVLPRTLHAPNLAVPSQAEPESPFCPKTVYPQMHVSHLKIPPHAGISALPTALQRFWQGSRWTAIQGSLFGHSSTVGPSLTQRVSNRRPEPLQWGQNFTKPRGNHAAVWRSYSLDELY